jgi:uncharacterized protein
MGTAEGGQGRRTEKAPPRRAQLRELMPEEIRAVLDRNRVARLAYSYRDQVGIMPVHYVMAEDWLYGRTSTGEKLEAIRHNWRVALEVDEIDDLFDWRSVVVKGGFFLLSPDRSPEDRDQWELGLEQVRRLVPETFTAADPTPERTTLFRVALQDVTGRECSLVP